MPKILLKFTLFFALIFHVFVIFFIFAPTTLLVAMYYGRLEALEPGSIPIQVSDFLDENPNKFSLTPTLAQQSSVIKQLAFEILMFRRDRFMNQEERRAYDLSVLNFGSEVVGMEAASAYYFQKPLSNISEAQWVMLLNWHEIFLK